MIYKRSRFLFACGILSAIVIILTGCSSKEKRPAYTDEGAPGRSLWMGQFVSAVIEVRGDPDIKLSVPSGDAFIYEPVAKVRMDIDSRPDCRDTYLINYKQRVVGFYCR